jgi:hypothetical protein
MYEIVRTACSAVSRAFIALAVVCVMVMAVAAGATAGLAASGQGRAAHPAGQVTVADGGPDGAPGQQPGETNWG